MRLVVGNFCAFPASFTMKLFFLIEKLLSIHLTNSDIASLAFILLSRANFIYFYFILLPFHIC